MRKGTLGLHDVEAPRLKDGHILIQVSHVGLCGSDAPKLLRAGDFALPEPWRPGHEIVGTDSAGRPVAVDPLVPCGDCTRCTDGSTHLCSGLRRLGWDLPGGFAEQVVAPTANTHPLLDGLDPLTAVLADPTAVAVHGLRCTPVGSPRRLAVIGAGTVGLLTALYAHRQGWEVAVVHRVGRAPHPSVTEAVPATFHSPAALPMDETFNVVVDAATGTDPAPLDLALRLVNDGGTVVVQNAYHPGVHLPTQLRDLFRRSIRLIGSFSYCRRHQQDDFTIALGLLGEHVDSMRHLVTEGGDLADLLSVLDHRSSQTVRQVLTI
ncbi:alcohol dehydrogenase catalytic domain-containing protein [Frankia sp. Cppng1_Ct_nod]|uniref:zinc-dependent alcohol dehydrogenase n=1 Tax=Frankia sp. Cppng1_Ct_nod TaxID=2897162 RepID=UPI0013EFA916|nr:alcohol dehydrogenase catalytic domain-containing protein [Frankia sp. Cppng1_Ct_nod]